MNILWKLVLVAFLLSFPAAGKAQEAQIGTGLVCDTARQVERFVSLLKDNARDALAAVNSEAGDPDACVVGTIVFVAGKGGAQIPHENGPFKVVEVLVLGLGTPSGLRQIQPVVWYTVIKVDEQRA